MPVPILICLQVLCVVLQQQSAQLEQSVGFLQLAHDVSPQPQVWHDGDDSAPNAIVKSAFAIASYLLSDFSTSSNALFQPTCKRLTVPSMSYSL